MKKLGVNCPVLVRVYGERIEREDFPLPNDPVLPTMKPSTVTEHRDIALHYLIRKPGNKYADRINAQYQALRRADPDEITYTQKKEYLKLLFEAQIEELKKAHIVLSTCTAASSGKITQGTNIQQVGI